MSEENGTASNAIWAVAMIIIVAIIAGVVYYSGVLNRKPTPAKTDVEIKVEVPAANK